VKLSDGSLPQPSTPGLDDSTPELARIIGAVAGDRRRPHPMGHPPSSFGIWLTRLTPAFIDGTQLMILLRSCLARTTLVRGDGISVLLRLHTPTRAILDGRHPLDRARSRRFWLKNSASRATGILASALATLLASRLESRRLCHDDSEESDPGVPGHWLCRRSRLADDL
jgi:hypothetical protein